MATMTVYGDTAKEMRDSGFDVRYPSGGAVQYGFSTRGQYNVQLADYIAWKNERKAGMRDYAGIKNNTE